jgi:hypothetical protein
MILGRLIMKVTAITAMISQAKRVTAVSLSSEELLYTLSINAIRTTTARIESVDFAKTFMFSGILVFSSL